MGQLEESSELTLDFTKLEKVGKQVADSRAAAVEHDPGVIPVAVQNADTKEVILVAYTNEFAMKESFAKRKLILWSTSRTLVDEPQQAVVQGRDLRRDFRSPRGICQLRAELAPLHRPPLPRRNLPHEGQGGRPEELLLQEDRLRYAQALVRRFVRKRDDLNGRIKKWKCSDRVWF